MATKKFSRSKRTSKAKARKPAARRSRANPHATAFNVRLGGKLIDTVYFKGTADEVKRSLISHDGYDPAIKVTRRVLPKRSNPRSASTKAQRGRMYVRMRDDARGYQGMGGHDSKYDAAIKALAGKVVEVDTTHLSDDQYNLKDYPVRVFDKQIVEVINDARRGRGSSTGSGEQGPTKGPKAAAFAAAARAEYEGSQYRKPGDPHDAYFGTVKPLRVAKAPKAPNQFGAWTSGGTVKKIYANGNVDLTNGKKLLGTAKARDAQVILHVGQKVYKSPEGQLYFVKKVDSYERSEGPMPHVLVTTAGGAPVRYLRPMRDWQATNIFGAGYRTLATPKVLAIARTYTGSDGGF